MAPEDLGVVCFRVDCRRILELRIRGLPAEVGKAAYRLPRQPSADYWIVRQAGYAVLFRHIRPIGAKRELSTLENGIGKPEVNERAGREVVVQTDGDLLVQYPHVTVGVAARRAGNDMILRPVE